MEARWLWKCIVVLTMLPCVVATQATAEDLSAGPFYVDEVYRAEIPFEGCKPMPQASFDKTMWEAPHGSVRLIDDASEVLLREHAYMLEDERGVAAVDSYAGLLTVRHDGSLDRVLVPGNVVAGSFGIRKIVDVRYQPGSMDDFSPDWTGAEAGVTKSTSYRLGGEVADGFAQVETIDVGWSELLCDADFVVQWDPIQEAIETTPIGGDCQGHSPCEVVMPVAQESAYDAPTFDPYASDDSVSVRGGGVFDCPKVKLGKFQVKPRLTFQAPSLTLTVRVADQVATLEGSAGIETGVLLSIQEEALVKLRCEADFLRMATGKELDITLTRIIVFGIPVRIYLKPFVTGWIELTSDVPRIEADLSASITPTLLVGWDRGPLADFDLNPDLDATVKMEPASGSNPWAANLKTGVDVGAELGAKAGGTILGVGTEVKLYVKPYERLSTELSMSSNKPCKFDLTAEVGTKIKFGIKFVLKIFFEILSIKKESIPIPIGATLTFGDAEFDLASFGCAEEPDWEIPLGGVDQWLCGQQSATFGGPGAQQACIDARTADPICAMGGQNPNGNECAPVGAEQALCSPCEALGFGGLWTYETYDCACGEPQPCEYPCCTANSDCGSSEFCNQAGQCQTNCSGFGNTCETGSDCCSGNCECVFGCGIPNVSIMACGS